jgi:hypothetical protein
MNSVEYTCEFLKKYRNRVQCIITKNTFSADDGVFLNLAYEAYLKGEEIDGQRFRTYVRSKRGLFTANKNTDDPEQ